MRHSLIAELGLLICEWMLSKMVGHKTLTLLTRSLVLMYMYMMAISYLLTSIATWRYWIGCAFALPTLPWTNWFRTSTQRLTKLRAVAALGRYFSLDSETLTVKDFLIYFFSVGFNIRIFGTIQNWEPSLHFYLKVWSFKKKSLEKALQVDQQFGKHLRILLFSIFKAGMPLRIFTTNCIARQC